MDTFCLLLWFGAVLRLMRVGRILICVYNTNKDSLLHLLPVRGLNGSVLRVLCVLRVERIPIDFHE
jgi:hypothetical protein